MRSFWILPIFTTLLDISTRRFFFSSQKCCLVVTSGHGLLKKRKFNCKKNALISSTLNNTVYRRRTLIHFIVHSLIEHHFITFQYSSNLLMPKRRCNTSIERFMSRPSMHVARSNINREQLVFFSYFNFNFNPDYDFDFHGSRYQIGKLSALLNWFEQTIMP